MSKAAVACCVQCRKFLFSGDDVVMVLSEPDGREIYSPCCSVECAQAYINKLETTYERKIQMLRERNKDLKIETL